jgi:ribosomal protein S11
MCIQATLENDNLTTISSVSGNITITNSQGQVAFQSTLTPFQAGSVKISTGSQLSFEFMWNTTNAYEGTTPQPGEYSVQVIVQFYGLSPMTYIESQVNCTLSAPP